MSISRDYKEIMQGEHSCGNWGSSAAKYSGASVVDVLRARHPIQTVLDFGAGKQSLEGFVRQHIADLDWTNYDPGIPGLDTLPSGLFDAVISTDVMEHVEPDELEVVIKLLGSLTKKVLIVDIACYPTGEVFQSGPYKGQDMHLIIEDPEWWRYQFNKYSGLQEFEFRHIERRNKGRVKRRCFIVYERV